MAKSIGSSMISNLSKESVKYEIISAYERCSARGLMETSKW